MGVTKKRFSGVWPVMLTPFDRNRDIDWTGVDLLVDWYVQSGCSGLFAVCLSSEMYHLSNDEKLRLAERVVHRSNGRLPIIASGTFGGEIADQAKFVRAMADTGVDAVVCIACQIVDDSADEDAWRARMSELLDKTGDILFGLYECPQPYHRLLSPELLRWVAETGRFLFLKETSADLELIKKKIAACAETPLAFFNAHSGTYLESLRAGGDGYSGIAANLYPSLFAWIFENYRDDPETAERVQGFIDLTARIVSYNYPGSAKRFLGLRGIPITAVCRKAEYIFSEEDIGELEALLKATLEWERNLGINVHAR